MPNQLANPARMSSLFYIKKVKMVMFCGFVNHYNSAAHHLSINNCLVCGSTCFRERAINILPLENFNVQIREFRFGPYLKRFPHIVFK